MTDLCSSLKYSIYSAINLNNPKTNYFCSKPIPNLAEVIFMENNSEKKNLFYFFLKYCTYLLNELHILYSHCPLFCLSFALSPFIKNLHIFFMPFNLSLSFDIHPQKHVFLSSLFLLSFYISAYRSIFFFLLSLSIFIIIIIILSCHGYPWPSLATPPYRSSLLAGLQGYIPYPHRAAVCMFKLVVLLLFGHVRGSIGVHHLWACPCFSSSVLHVWFI